MIRGKQDEDHYNIYYEIDESEQDISDHYPVVATFTNPIGEITIHMPSDSNSNHDETPSDLQQHVRLDHF